MSRMKPKTIECRYQIKVKNKAKRALQKLIQANRWLREATDKAEAEEERAAVEAGVWPPDDGGQS